MENPFLKNIKIPKSQLNQDEINNLDKPSEKQLELAFELTAQLDALEIEFDDDVSPDMTGKQCSQFIDKAITLIDEDRKTRDNEQADAFYQEMLRQAREFF